MSFDPRVFEAHCGMLDVANQIFEIGCILDKTRSSGGMGFRLKLHEKTPDAPLSPIYINLRILRSFPLVSDSVVALFGAMFDDGDIRCDLVADVPTAATPLVSVFSHENRIPMVTPREEKSHGAGGTIDGVFETGQMVLVMDDLITKADSKFAAIRTLERHGLKVNDVLVLVDREQGGVQELEAAGYRVHAAFKISDLLGLYQSTGKITEEVYAETMAYLGLVA